MFTVLNIPCHFFVISLPSSYLSNLMVLPWTLYMLEYDSGFDLYKFQHPSYFSSSSSLP